MAVEEAASQENNSTIQDQGARAQDQGARIEAADSGMRNQESGMAVKEAASEENSGAIRPPAQRVGIPGASKAGRVQAAAGPAGPASLTPKNEGDSGNVVENKEAGGKAGEVAGESAGKMRGAAM